MKTFALLLCVFSFIFVFISFTNATPCRKPAYPVHRAIKTVAPVQDKVLNALDDFHRNLKDIIYKTKQNIITSYNNAMFHGNAL